MEKEPVNEIKEAYEMGAAIRDIDLLEYDCRISDDGSTYIFEEYSSEKVLKQNEFGEEINLEVKEKISTEESQEETGGMSLC